ncbi:MAG: hypothetical protein ACFBSD_08355 [Paracoccaceae bacterium]
METDIPLTDDIVASVEQISTTVWVAIGLLVAGLVWLLKWLVTVLFVQGRGVSLVTIPFSRVAGKILEDRFVQKLADTRTLPKLHIPASWEEFNRFNGYVAHRMLTYRELIQLVQTKFNGPSAVSLRVVVRYFEPTFVDTFRTAERGFRDLDRIDDRVRATHRALHAKLQEKTDALSRRRIQAEKDYEMARIRRKHALAARPVSLWLRRRLGQTMGGLVSGLVNAIWSGGTASKLRAEKRRLRDELNELRLEIAEQSREIFSEHEAEVVGLCLELIEHDRMFLQHLYHRFGLEVESLLFTVASGRVLERLAGEDETAERARAELGIGDLARPDGRGDPAARFRDRIRADRVLNDYVGLGPESVLEGTLEAFLRVHILTGQLRIEGYSRNWVAHLPPPGEFGRSHSEYGHFAHQLAWLKKPLPGMVVAENGLVGLDDLPPRPEAGAAFAGREPAVHIA